MYSNTLRRRGRYSTIPAVSVSWSFAHLQDTSKEHLRINIIVKSQLKIFLQFQNTHRSLAWKAAFTKFIIWARRSYTIFLMHIMHTWYFSAQVVNSVIFQHCRIIWEFSIFKVSCWSGYAWAKIYEVFSTLDFQKKNEPSLKHLLIPCLIQLVQKPS